MQLLMGYIAVLIFMVYYVSVVGYLTIQFVSAEEGNSDEQPMVSVVVAARNEEENIAACLDCLVAQTYPREKLEIVVVDDRSMDTTPQIFDRWRSKHPQIKTIHIKEKKEGIGPKKHALANGIAASSGEVLFLTDADCRPPKTWVKEMMRHFEPDVGLVAGFAPLTSGYGTLWSRILEFDSVATALVAAAGISSGKPITCNGRNLTYRRRAYEQVDGFASSIHTLSGDDDLFMHQVARNTLWNMRFATSPQTFVPSAAPKNLREFFQQRRRHISAGRHYPLSVKCGYLSLHVSNLIIICFPLLAAVLGLNVIMPIVAVLIKLVVDAVALGTATRQFRCTYLLKFFPLWEIFFVGSHLLLAPLSLCGRIPWRE